MGNCEIYVILECLDNQSVKLFCPWWEFGNCFNLRCNTFVILNISFESLHLGKNSKYR